MGPFPRPFTFPDCHLPSCDDEDRHCFIQYRYGRGAPWIRGALNDGLCWARIDGGFVAGASGWQRAHCLRRIRGTLNDGLCCCRARIDGGSAAGASGWQRAHCLRRIRGEGLDGAPFAAYNKSAVRARLRLKVDARRGRNDPRKSAKVR